MFQTICYESLKICSGLWPTYKTETPVTPARMGLGGHTGGLEQASLGWAAEQQKSENTRLLAGLLHLWSIRRTATARLSIIRSSLISLGYFKIPGVVCLSGTNTWVNTNSRFLSSPSYFRLVFPTVQILVDVLAIGCGGRSTVHFIPEQNNRFIMTLQLHNECWVSLWYMVVTHQIMVVVIGHFHLRRLCADKSIF